VLGNQRFEGSGSCSPPKDYLQSGPKEGTRGEKEWGLHIHFSPNCGKIVAQANHVSAKQADWASNRWLLAALGVAAFHLSYLLAGGERGLWVPAVGVGIALTAWVGFWILPLLMVDAVLVGLIVSHEGGILRVVLDSVLLTGQVGWIWYAYNSLAGGTRRLNDPRSATLFLILGPGVVEAFFGVAQAGLWKVLGATEDLRPLAGELWIGRALGTLALVPALMVVVTPWLVKNRIVEPEASRRIPGGSQPQDWTWGEAIETAGLAIGNCILALVLVIMQRDQGFPGWAFMGMALLLVVWASLRQGLRGGALVAGLGAGLALTVATGMGVDAAGLSPLQGNLLAQCSTALLVGASAGWIRASEARYRQVVGHIPVVLYSAHLPRGLKVYFSQRGERKNLHPKSDPDLATGQSILDQAEITLVSPASKQIYGCEPEGMLGPYREWLDRILPTDRELLIAAVNQLCYQDQPVTCEYRLLAPGQLGAKEPGGSSWMALEHHRWVRDTMVPSFTSEGMLSGWEGVVEDITEQQALSLRLRRTSNMLQALVSNLPMGVFFVQGPIGQPILVNARARQLLGQREDLAAGIARLSQVYRLHRADGSPYPTEELPVSKALRQGITSMANDIIIHHPDGRHVPLITWAAPVDLAGNGKTDAAVWVLEDLTALHQAELARRESETRLRIIIETMAEGLIIQNQTGAVVDCNPAAAAILGTTPEALLGRVGLGPEKGCLREDHGELPREQQPDFLTLHTGSPVRHLVLGLPLKGKENGQLSTRWILVNSMPLPTGSWIGPHSRGARLVTTFADVTGHRQALEVLSRAKEKYQDLVENLPLMVLQLDADSRITFLNPATERITGWPAQELRQPGVWAGLILDEGVSEFQTALARGLAGYHARVEFRFKAKDGSTKVGLALVQPLIQEDKIQGCTCLIVDMTLQRTLEAELQRAQQLELVGRLAGGTVHDFNNLLTVMVGLGHLAQTSMEKSHPAYDYLQHLIEAGEQASHLAGQILTFSKIRHVTNRVVDLNGVILHSLRLLRSVMLPIIKVETFLAKEEVQVQGEENQLKQVVMNLCLNARDAMPRGGKLTLRTELMSSSEAPEAPESPESSRKPQVRLTIEDNGQGMDEATLARIFEPFFSTKERGTGLGMTVVRQIIESFGGQIQVFSKPNQGTRMEVWLQKARQNPIT
jgi:PAS domain S-box-containing protein